MWQACLCKQKGSPQIHGHDSVPFVDGDGCNQCVWIDGRVGHEDVDLAMDHRYVMDCFIHFLLICGVDMEIGHLEAPAHQIGCGSPPLVIHDAGDHDTGSGARQFGDDAKADAALGTGDDGNAMSEIKGLHTRS